MDDAAEGQYSEQFVSETFTIVKLTLITMTFGRLLLLLISVKNPEICRVYLYYQAIYKAVEMLLPRDYGTVQANLILMVNLFDFLML